MSDLNKISLDISKPDILPEGIKSLQSLSAEGRQILDKLNNIDGPIKTDATLQKANIEILADKFTRAELYIQLEQIRNTVSNSENLFIGPLRILERLQSHTNTQGLSYHELIKMREQLRKSAYTAFSQKKFADAVIYSSQCYNLIAKYLELTNGTKLHHDMVFELLILSRSCAIIDQKERGLEYKKQLNYLIDNTYKYIYNETLKSNQTDPNRIREAWINLGKVNSSVVGPLLKTEPAVFLALLREGADLCNIYDDEEGANQYYKQLVAFYEYLYGPAHPLTADCCIECSYHFFNNRNFHKALEYAEKCLRIRIQIFGDVDSETPSNLTSDAYQNVGMLYRLLGYPQDSLSALLSALDIRLRLTNGDRSSQDCLSTLLSIGILCHQYGQYRRASELYKEVYEGLRKYKGFNSPEITKICQLMNTLVKDISSATNSGPVTVTSTIEGSLAMSVIDPVANPKTGLKPILWNESITPTLNAYRKILNRDSKTIAKSYGFSSVAGISRVKALFADELRGLDVPSTIVLPFVQQSFICPEMLQFMNYLQSFGYLSSDSNWISGKRRIPIINIPCVIAGHPVFQNSDATNVAMEMNSNVEPYCIEFDLPIPSVDENGNVTVNDLGNNPPQIFLPILDNDTNKILVGFNGVPIMVELPIIYLEEDEYKRNLQATFIQNKNDNEVKNNSTKDDTPAIEMIKKNLDITKFNNNSNNSFNLISSKQVIDSTTKIPLVIPKTDNAAIYYKTNSISTTNNKLNNKQNLQIITKNSGSIENKAINTKKKDNIEILNPSSGNSNDSVVFIRRKSNTASNADTMLKASNENKTVEKLHSKESAQIKVATPNTVTELNKVQEPMKIYNESKILNDNQAILEKDNMKKLDSDSSKTESNLVKNESKITAKQLVKLNTKQNINQNDTEQETLLEKKKANTITPNSTNKKQQLLQSSSNNTLSKTTNSIVFYKKSKPNSSVINSNNNNKVLNEDHDSTYKLYNTNQIEKVQASLNLSGNTKVNTNVVKSAISEQLNSSAESPKLIKNDTTKNTINFAQNLKKGNSISSRKAKLSNITDVQSIKQDNINLNKATTQKANFNVINNYNNTSNANKQINVKNANETNMNKNLQNSYIKQNFATIMTKKVSQKNNLNSIINNVENDKNSYIMRQGSIESKISISNIDTNLTKSKVITIGNHNSAPKVDRTFNAAVLIKRTNKNANEINNARSKLNNLEAANVYVKQSKNINYNKEHLNNIRTIDIIEGKNTINTESAKYEQNAKMNATMFDNTSKSVKNLNGSTTNNTINQQNYTEKIEIASASTFPSLINKGIRDMRKNTTKYKCKMATASRVFGVRSGFENSPKGPIPIINLIDHEGNLIESIPYFLDFETYFARVALICAKVKKNVINDENIIPPLKNIVNALAPTISKYTQAGDGLAMMGTPFGLSGTVFGTIPTSGPKGIGGYGAVGSHVPVEYTIPVGRPGDLTTTLNRYDKDVVDKDMFGAGVNAKSFKKQGQDFDNQLFSFGPTQDEESNINKNNENTQNLMRTAQGVTQQSMINALEKQKKKNQGNNLKSIYDDADYDYESTDESFDNEIKSILKSDKIASLSKNLLDTTEDIWASPEDFKNFIAKVINTPIKPKFAAQKFSIDETEKIDTSTSKIISDENAGTGTGTGIASTKLPSAKTLAKPPIIAKKIPSPPKAGPKLIGKKAPPPKKSSTKVSTKLSKYKKLAWDPIEDPNGTIFINKFADYLESLNLGDIDEYFERKTQTKKEETSKNKEPSIIRLLTDQKRAFNMGIALAKFNHISLADLRDAIIDLNPNIITDEAAEILIKYTPTPEEIALVTDYIKVGGDITKLDKPEQFIAAVMGIPIYKQRLVAYQYIRNFNAYTDDIIVPLNQYIDACKDVANSSRIKKLLSAILKIGNILNKTEAIGFKTNLLPKLLDVKTSTKPVKTLIEYLVDLFWDVDPDVLEVKNDFSALKALSRVDLQTIEARIIAYVTGFKNLKSIHEVSQKFNSNGPEIDSIEIVLSNFISSNEHKLEEANEKLKETQALFMKTAMMFGEDANSLQKLKPEVFLKDFITFVHQIDNSKMIKQQKIEREAKSKQFMNKLAQKAESKKQIQNKSLFSAKDTSNSNIIEDKNSDDQEVNNDRSKNVDKITEKSQIPTLKESIKKLSILQT